MGIQNLLPVCSSITERKPLSTFAGKKVAIDGFVWLHRAAYTCADELAINPSTISILPFLQKRLQVVLNAGITPIIVFDGHFLPSKSLTNQKRREKRHENLLKAHEFTQLGQYDFAHQYYLKAIEILPETVHTWIKELRRARIEYFVAPYEADAQLAYLAQIGYVDAVLTEDSDLLAYGCPITLFKMDEMSNVCMIKYENVLTHLSVTSLQFKLICALAGCDYIEHIKGIGIQKSLKIVKSLFPTILDDSPNSIHQALLTMLFLLKTDKKLMKTPEIIPNHYENQLLRAILTFTYQRIYDPISKIMKPLHSPLPDLKIDLSFTPSIPSSSDLLNNQDSQNNDSQDFDSSFFDISSESQTFNENININLNDSQTFNENININLNENQTFNENINLNDSQTFNENINLNESQTLNEILNSNENKTFNEIIDANESQDFQYNLLSNNKNQIVNSNLFRNQGMNINCFSQDFIVRRAHSNFNVSNIMPSLSPVNFLDESDNSVEKDYWDFIGKIFAPDILEKIVKGLIHPITFQKFENEMTFSESQPVFIKKNEKTNLSNKKSPRKSKGKNDVPVPAKNQLTNYFKKI